jgi:hypothetical protein
MIITDYKITKYGEVELHGTFESEKETEQYNRNGTTATQALIGNKGLRDIE